MEKNLKTKSQLDKTLQESQSNDTKSCAFYRRYITDPKELAMLKRAREVMPEWLRLKLTKALNA